MVTLHCGDCLDILREIDALTVDAIVTDPPYGLRLMGRKWDYDVPSVEVWRECLRVLRPGGYLLSFASTRTQHRICVNIEDAGFEIRDLIAWAYGSGFPKSQTYLKPAFDPITMARKPLEGTIAQNKQKYGTGGLNVESCRIQTDDCLNGGAYSGQKRKREGCAPDSKADCVLSRLDRGAGEFKPPEGRWPANLIHDGGEEIEEIWGLAARFYYVPKVTKEDRGRGNKHPTVKPTDLMRYLCRLVVPPGGTVLDPYMGSGSTGKAAILEGFDFIGIEREQEWVDVARHRCGD